MRSVGLGLVLSLAFAAPASAFFKCKSWVKLDDAGKRASMQALNDKFDRYIWNCVGRRR